VHDLWFDQERRAVEGGNESGTEQLLGADVVRELGEELGPAVAFLYGVRVSSDDETMEKKVLLCSPYYVVGAET